MAHRNPDLGGFPQMARGVFGWTEMFEWSEMETWTASLAVKASELITKIDRLKGEVMHSVSPDLLCLSEPRATVISDSWIHSCWLAIITMFFIVKRVTGKVSGLNKWVPHEPSSMILVHWTASSCNCYIFRTSFKYSKDGWKSPMKVSSQNAIAA